MKTKNLREKTKLLLTKAMVIPILEYPTTPNIALSKYRIKKLQRIQNKALKFAINNNNKNNRAITTEELHRRGK